MKITIDCLVLRDTLQEYNEGIKKEPDTSVMANVMPKSPFLMIQAT